MWKGAVVLCGHKGIVLTRFQLQTRVTRGEEGGSLASQSSEASDIVLASS